MKKVLIFLCVIFTVMLASCSDSKEETYTKEEMKEAIAEAVDKAYQRGYDEGYDLAKYEDRGQLEEYNRYGNDAYDAGYERGYEEGYDDCLEEHGLAKEYAYDPNDPPRIKKDK